MKRLCFYLLCCLAITLSCLSVYPVSAEAPARPKIVFTDTRDGNAEIYVMNTDGSEKVRLTHHPGDDFDPAWSPNGEHIAFVSERDHMGLYDIYLMDPDGKNIRQAFDDLDFRTAPTWSPDGEKIAYHTYSSEPDWAVYANTPGGGEAERIAESGVHFGGFPDWSPKGTEVAFVGGKRTQLRIQIINLKTGNQETLLPDIESSNMYYPTWSPDGKKLAFSLWQHGQQPGIHIVNRNAKKSNEIIKNARGMLAWSPNGRKLLYKKTVDGEKQLFKIDLDSRVETPLTPLGPTIRHGENTGWDWFKPPISPKPQLLTTVWGEIKIQD